MNGPISGTWLRYSPHASPGSPNDPTKVPVRILGFTDYDSVIIALDDGTLRTAKLADVTIAARGPVDECVDLHTRTQAPRKTGPAIGGRITDLSDEALDQMRAAADRVLTLPLEVPVEPTPEYSDADLRRAYDVLFRLNYDNTTENSGPYRIMPKSLAKAFAVLRAEVTATERARAPHTECEG